MNKQIVENLFELWKLIGTSTQQLVETDNHTIVSIPYSDWPNRIFDIQNTSENLLSELELAFPKLKLVSLEEDLSHYTNTNPNTNLELTSTLKNMAIELENYPYNSTENTNIYQVSTLEHANTFAQTATKAFGYKVDASVIKAIMPLSSKLRLYLYGEKTEALGCGIVFFDSNNNAGLHMIGTLPQSRGKGVGKAITQHLLGEAKLQGAKMCVLHASKLGEPIYSKLGFKPYGELNTFRFKNTPQSA